MSAWRGMREAQIAEQMGGRVRRQEVQEEGDIRAFFGVGKRKREVGEKEMGMGRKRIGIEVEVDAVREVVRDDGGAFRLDEPAERANEQERKQVFDNDEDDEYDREWEDIQQGLLGDAEKEQRDANQTSQTTTPKPQTTTTTITTIPRTLTTPRINEHDIPPTATTRIASPRATSTAPVNNYVPPPTATTTMASIATTSTIPTINEDDSIPPPSAQQPPSTSLPFILPADHTPKPIFTSLTIYINGSTLPLITDFKLRHLLLSHGANIALGLARKKVTHVILGTPNLANAHNPTIRGAPSIRGNGGGLAAGKLQREIKRVGGSGVKYVGVEWYVQPTSFYYIVLLRKERSTD